MIRTGIQDLIATYSALARGERQAAVSWRDYDRRSPRRVQHALREAEASDIRATVLETMVQDLEELLQAEREVA